MSSLFFTCKGQVRNLPNNLRQQAKFLLERALPISAGAMVWRYSNEGRVETAAVLEWVDHDLYGVGEAYFWRGYDMPPELYEALVTDSLEGYCLKRAARLPFVHEYIKTPCLAFASGSHLYGLAGRQADWDAVVLVDDPRPLKTDDTEPYFRVYTPGLLFQDARRGFRHAWELLTAPERAQMTWDTPLERTRQQALKTLSRVTIPWREGSRYYFDTWYPRFFIRPGDEADPSIRRWKMAKGWPYKLGYYIFVDAYLSSMAAEAGRYQTGVTDQEIVSVLCRMKQGEMVLQEWLDLISPLLPEGCSLKDSEGRLPVEFREVRTDD